MEHRPRLLVANHSGYPVDIPRNATDFVRETAVRSVIEAQDGAGVDVVTCGHLGEINPLEPLIRGLEGLDLGDGTCDIPIWGQVRIPKIIAAIRWTQPLLAREVAIANETTSRAIKVTMAGPYTLASLIRDFGGVYDSFGACIDACAKAMAKEVRNLAKQGVAMIQVAEPLFIPKPADFPRLREALIPLSEAKSGMQLLLALSGEGICPLYDWLQNLPVDGLCLDLVRSPGLVNMIGDRETPLTLGLGLVDAESLSLETAERIFPLLDQMIAGISASDVHIQPSSTLCHLPPEGAQGKLSNLVNLIREYRSRISSDN